MPADKPGILRNLRIKRVAIVDMGANFDRVTGDGAHILLHKSASPKKVPPVTPQSQESIVKNKFLKGLLGLIAEPDVEKRTAAAIALEKEFPPEDDDKVVHKADMGDMCKCADCMAKVAKAAKDKEDADAAELAKNSGAVAKKLVDLEKANSDLQKRLDAQIEKGDKDDIRTVLKSFKKVAVDLNTDVDVFHKMRKSDPATYDRTIALMQASDEQLAASALYTNVGGGGDAMPGSAWAQIEAKADAMVEKSTKEITREQAINKVMESNPALVKQYRAEQH